MKRIVSGLILIALLTGMLASTFKIQPDKTVAVDIGNPKLKVKKVNLDIPKPNALKIGVYDWLQIPECSYVSIRGHPCLPMKSIVIKLPLSSVVEGVEMTVQNVTLEGFYQIAPSLAPKPLNATENLNETSEPDPLIYGSQSLYPEEWFSYRTANGLDNESNQRVTYVLIYFYPLRYLPKQRTITWAHHASAIINYEEQPEMPTPSEQIDNIVITSPLLEHEALRLGEWKNRTGMITRVVNTDWIYGRYSGIDRQEQIRNCIKDFMLNQRIEFATIFGDVDQVPVRYAYVPDPEVGETYVPTDLYYADLDGTWDDNLDGLYADQRYDEVDGIPDVRVGRIPTSFTESAGVMVDHIKGYQQHFDELQDWTHRVVLVAGTGNGLGTATTNLKDYIANVISNMDVVKRYYSTEYLAPNDIVYETNRGCLFLNFAGHGDQVRWFLDWLLFLPIFFTTSHLGSLTNGYMLPVITTMSCSTASFDTSDCIGELFLGQPDGGAIAYFGATRIAWGYVDELAPYGLMGEMDRRIYESFYEGFTKLGEMWGQPVTEYVQSHIWDYQSASIQDVKTFMEFALLGDPTLSIGKGVTPTLFLDPSEIVGPAPNVGDNLTWALKIDLVYELYAWTVDIEWDSTKLRYVNTAEGDCLEGNPAGCNTMFLEGSVTPGKIEGMMCTLMGDPATCCVDVPPSPNDLANVTFRVLNHTCEVGTWINITYSKLKICTGEDVFPRTENAKLTLCPCDLAITNFILPYSHPKLYANMTYDIGVNVTNLGSSSAGSFNVSLELFWEKGGTNYYAEKTVAALGAGESTIVLFNDVMITCCGDYWLNVTVDCNNDVAESNETNNSMVINIDGRLAGDLDGDHDVDFDDIVMIAMAYGSKPEAPNWNPNADIDCDGDVDFDDVVTAAMNYGRSDC